MAIFTDPAFNKELVAQAKVQGKATAKVKEFEEAIDELTESLYKLDFESQEYRDKQKEIKRQEIKLKDAETTAEKAVDFKKMNDSLFKISEGELERRKEFDASEESRKNILEQLKENSPEAAEEIAAAERNIQLARDKEDIRREKQATSILKKGFTGLGNSIKEFAGGMKDTAITSLKGGLLIAAYFALAKFLQSDIFERVTKFIGEFMKAIKASFDYIMKPGGIFDGLLRAFSGIIDIFEGVFKIIAGIFTGDGQKILEGFRGIFSGIIAINKALFEAVFSVVSDLAVGLFNVIKSVVMGIFNIVASVFNFIDDLTGGMYTNIITSIMSAVEMFTGGFVKMFEGDILGGLADIILSPFKLIGELAANVFRGLIDSILNVVNMLPGVDIKNPFDVAGKAPKETEAPQFLKDLQGPTLADRAGALRVREEGSRFVVNNISSNSVVDASNNATNSHAIRLVKDQGSAFTSTNA